MFYQIAAAGAGAAPGGVSAAVAIPNDASGNRARFVLISVSKSTYVRPGDSTVTAANTDLLVNPQAPVALNVNGQTHIAHLEAEVAAGRIVISPIEHG